MKLLLIDLDGTIRQNRYNPGNYINQPDEVELIPGVSELLQRYQQQGWLIVGISNQGGIEKGFTTLSAVLEGMQRTVDLAPMIDSIYFCPQAHPALGRECHQCGYVSKTCWASDEILKEHYGFEITGFRKPQPGMLQVAIANCFSTPTEILYVGDRPEDQEAAQSAGIPFQWAHEWREGK